MKLNRFIALAAIAMLVVGAMGAVSMKAFAQSATPPAQTQTCDQQEDDSAQAQKTPDCSARFILPFSHITLRAGSLD